MQQAETKALSTRSATSSISPIDRLFGELHGMFGNKLLDQFRSGHVVDGLDTGIENMKATWAEKIRSNGLMLSDVKRGLAGCERLKWPPTWGEFLDLCKPALDPNVALSEGISQMRARAQCQDVWSDPAIFWASVKVGQYDMLSQPHAALLPRFKRALEEVLKTEVLPVPPSVPALAYDVGTVSTKEKATEQLKRLGALGVINKKESGIEWAHKMLDRVKRGEHIPGNGPEIARRVIAERSGVVQ